MGGLARSLSLPWSFFYWLALLLRMCTLACLSSLFSLHLSAHSRCSLVCFILREALWCRCWAGARWQACCVSYLCSVCIARVLVCLIGSLYTAIVALLFIFCFWVGRGECFDKLAVFWLFCDAGGMAMEFFLALIVCIYQAPIISYQQSCY